MQPFSTRQGLDPGRPRQPIEDDVPQWLRSRFIALFAPFWYLDRDPRYPNEEHAPIGVKGIHERFCQLLREEAHDEYFDSWHAGEALADHLRACTWYHFLDFVELVGTRLKDAEEGHNFEPDWLERFGYEAYRKQVNEAFTEERLVWRLDSRGQLVRQAPPALQARIEAVEQSLADEYSPARDHFRKAQRFLTERPLDPENAIKEVVSAVESVARVICPKASTLGAALKELQKKRALPGLLIDSLEKLYAYASAEPAVRHGAPAQSRVSLHDAELAFHVSAAFIRYLIALREAKAV